MATSLLAWEAGSALLPATGAPAVTYTAGTNFVYCALGFDQTAVETVYFHGVVAQSYTGNITIEIYWKASTTGNVVWGAKFLGRADSETYDAALSAQTTVTDAVTGANNLNVATISIAAPALTIGDALILEIQRVADNGSDTLAADALLMNVELRMA